MKPSNLAPALRPHIPADCMIIPARADNPEAGDVCHHGRYYSASNSLQLTEEAYTASCELHGLLTIFSEAAAGQGDLVGIPEETLGWAIQALERMANDMKALNRAVQTQAYWESRP